MNFSDAEFFNELNDQPMALMHWKKKKQKNLNTIKMQQNVHYFIRRSISYPQMPCVKLFTAQM